MCTTIFKKTQKGLQNTVVGLILRKDGLFDENDIKKELDEINMTGYPNETIVEDCKVYSFLNYAMSVLYRSGDIEYVGNGKYKVAN